MTVIVINVYYYYIHLIFKSLKEYNGAKQKSVHTKLTKNVDPGGRIFPKSTPNTVRWGMIQ